MTGIITSIPPLVEQPPGNNSNNPAGLPGVTYTAMISLMLANTIKGNNTGSTANATDLTGDLVEQMLLFKQTGTGAVQRLVDAKLNDVISVKDFGAAGNGATNDTAAIQAAITASSVNQPLDVPAGTYSATAKPTNSFGAPLGTAGEILIPDARGGFQRINSYGDFYKVAIGKEYLFRAYQRIALGQGSATGTLKAFVYGDSTIAGGNGESAGFKADQLLARYFNERGLPNINITNRGVAGTQITDLNAIPDISATTDLFIIKYGINDGTQPLATRLSTFATGLRSKLAAIRANGQGGIQSLAILLVGPNATNDSPSGRDERWYEQLRNIYVQAARDYNCAYFDTYAFLRDARPAAGLWMDNPFANGIAIHPMDHMQSWIWGTIFDTFFGVAETRMYATNSFTNVSGVLTIPLASALPATYTPGITIQRATPANGWPDDGSVETVRHTDSVAFQRMWPFAANRTRSYFRTANVGANTWNRWTGVYENITLAAGWVSAGGFATAQACISEDGHVQVKGLISSGTITAGTTIGTLPAGMAPAENHMFAVALNAGIGQIKVTAAGALVAQTALDAGYTSLSQIRFFAA